MYQTVQARIWKEVGGMELVTRIDVAAAPAAVWSALVEVGEWPKWTKSMDSVELLDEGPLRLGSRARIKQPGMPALIWEVTELTEGRSFTWQAKTPGAVTIGRHEVTATADGSSLLLSVEQHGLLAAILKPLTGARVRRFMQMEAEGLKACSEKVTTAGS
jgi:uncharacterized membrane protein